MPDLKRPSEPRRISELSFHEPMRMMWNGEPIVGMLVGNESFPTLLVIRKDGAITSVRNPANDGIITFIDYLLEDEFFSVYGSSKERSDEADLGPDPAADPFHMLKPGDWIYDEAPSFVPFWVNGMDGEILCMLVPTDKPHGRAILTFEMKRGSSTEWHDSGYDWADASRSSDRWVERRYKFKGPAPIEMRKLFKRNPMAELVEKWPF